VTAVVHPIEGDELEHNTPSACPKRATKKTMAFFFTKKPIAYPPRIRGLEKNVIGFFVALFGQRA
jgi:hypothetical protein